jgi:hypothetical protein
MTDLRPGNDDEDLLRYAFRAAIDGPYLAVGEFTGLMGFSRDDLRQLRMQWPKVANHERLDLAITKVIENLILAPRDQWDGWRHYSGSWPSDIAALLDRWRTGTSPVPRLLHRKRAQPRERPLEEAIEIYFHDLWIIAEPRRGSSPLTAMTEIDGWLDDWVTETLRTQKGAEQVWPVILELIARVTDDHSRQVIANGPLRDLVEAHGETLALHLIERTASDSNFRQVIQWQWGASVSTWLRTRLESLVIQSE